MEQKARAMLGLHFIGIDIGTSTICGVIYDTESRKMRSIVKENASKLETANEWEDLQDPQIILSIVQGILNEFIKEYKTIKGIGITGQMHGILYVDKNGNSISPLYTWQDGRGNLIYNNDLSYSDYLSDATGYSIPSGYGLATHFYNLKNGIIPEISFKICTIMDYVVMKLTTGNIPVTDNSNGASLGFFDLRNSRFDLEAIKKVSIDPEILPEILPANQIIGKYNNDIFVCNAIGDNQASILGSANDIEKSIFINIGTSSQISIYIDKYVQIETLELRPFPGGGYILVGSALCGGHSIVILKNFFDEVLKMYCMQPIENLYFYKAMNSLDYSGEDLMESIQVEVLFRGARLSPYKRGLIKNISTTNFTPVNLIFGFLHGICNELFDFYSKIPEINDNKIESLVGSGNAIRKNTILTRMLEDKFGHKMVIPEYCEEAAFGASICAMVGGNYIDNFLDIMKIK
jgi:sedoheptulokinase